MAMLLSIVIGALYAAGTYMILGRSLFRLIFGLVLLSHAANLLIFAAAGLTRAQPPIVPAAESGGKTTALASGMADPLPQAMILTAIVINFGLLAFALVLFHRAYHTIGTDDLNELKASD
jgi:multicomponent Na+:H+ antiporter subunit C